MRKKLLIFPILLGGFGGVQAQEITGETPLYKEGIVTDLSQLEDGDYVLLQNASADTTHCGFLNIDASAVVNYRNDTYNKDLGFLDRYYKGGFVFQIKIVDNTYKFLNISTSKYLKNTTDAQDNQLQVTETDANNTFSISSSTANGDNKWIITSTENGTPGICAEENSLELTGNGDPYYIHKLTTTRTETPWYYLAVYGFSNDARKGHCIEHDSQKQYVYTGNTIASNDLDQIWKVEEDPTQEDVFALVNKNGGSIGAVSSPGSGGARYVFSSEEAPVYQFQIRKGLNVNNVATMNILRTEARDYWCINAAGGEYFLNEWNKPNQTNYLSGAWSAVIATELKTTNEGYALGTFSAPYNVELPTGVSAYIATQNNTTSITLQELTLTNNVLPANTPVVLRSETEGFYPMKQTATEASAINSVNLLKGTGSERTLSSGAFILSSNNGEVGFYNYTGSAIGAFKAYLPKTTSDGEQIRVKSIQFSGEGTTGIHNVENCTESKNTPIYNLNGQQVTNLTKGIYIQNGKKFIIK